MNNYHNQTPPPVLRNHHQHQQQQQQQLHHNNHHFSTSAATAVAAAVPSTIQLTPSHQMHHLHQNHGMLLHHHPQLQQHHFATPAASSLPPLPPPPSTPQSLAAVSTTTSSSSSSAITNLATPQQQPQPLISNSLAIRQEIQRFESVHPSIYAIYDLIDLLPITDAQIAQQIRDHVVCIEAITPETQGLILNSQAKKVVKNLLTQMPCGWPEYGIPPLAPYTHHDLKIHLVKSFVDSFVELIRFRFEGLDQMVINKLKVSYTFKKHVKFHITFKELKASSFRYDTNTFLDAMKQLGLTVRYEGIGSLEFALENLSIEGEFKYKMPYFFGSIQIYKFKCVVTLGSVRSNIGGILGEGKLNALINSQIEDIIPTIVNSNQAKINAVIEANVVPRVNAMFKGKKIWFMLGQLGGSNRKCNPTPAPW